jgi:hypothetical protein
VLGNVYPRDVSPGFGEGNGETSRPASEFQRRPTVADDLAMIEIEHAATGESAHDEVIKAAVAVKVITHFSLWRAVADDEMSHLTPGITRRPKR